MVSYSSFSFFVLLRVIRVLFLFSFIVAINTLFSGIFAIAIGITAQVMLNSPDLWYLDAAESMIFAFLLGIYGIKVIAENVAHNKRDKEFKNFDNGSSEISASGVHEKSKLVRVASCKTYTTFPNNRSDA